MKICQGIGTPVWGTPAWFRLVCLWLPTILPHLKGHPIGSVPMGIATEWEGVPVALLGRSPAPDRADTSPDGQVHKQMASW